jgi:hypothetical protein
MTPHQQKLRLLVDRLTSRTSTGVLRWRTDGGRLATAKMQNGLVEVKSDKDSSGQDAIRITVYDLAGDSKLSFDDTALIFYDERGNAEYYFSEMEELLESALRSARGEEQVLNKLLDELDDDSF